MLFDEVRTPGVVRYLHFVEQFPAGREHLCAWVIGIDDLHHLVQRFRQDRRGSCHHSPIVGYPGDSRNTPLGMSMGSVTRGRHGMILPISFPKNGVSRSASDAQ